MRPAPSRTKAARFARIVLTLAPLLLIAGNARGTICKEGVNTGETTSEVAAKCGEAALKDQRTLTVEETDKEGSRKTTTVIEEWTYDRGPEELVHVFRFENGSVADIANHGYGSVRDFSVDTCHNGEALAVGDTMVDAYLKCGTPLGRQNLSARVEVVENEEYKRKTTIPVTEWTYRYGRDLPGYTVTFENGTAVKIRAREFGK